MKTHIQKILAVALIFIGINATAQTRYLDNMFDSVTVTSDVQYATNISVLPMLQGLAPGPAPLLCDIYEPKNDTMTDRPVIVLIHTGSFLPAVLNGQATGSKTDLSVVENCMRWAKKGYVAVAMDNRLGWNPTSPDQNTRTSTILQAAYRGIQDAKAMVRYMRKTVAEDGNLYGIDDSKIVLGGQGTGGYLSMGYITLDTVAELYLPKFMDLTTSPPTPFVFPPFFGNIDGTDTTYLPDFASPTGQTELWNIPNNPTYSNDVNMAFNLGGTLADLSWLDYTGIPLVSFHCENDPFASIDSGQVIVPTTGDLVISDVVGSRTAAHYNTLWNNNAGFNQAGLTDTLTQMSNAYNSAWDSQHGLVYDGLYVFDTPDPSTTPNAFGEMPYHESSPWDWWDLPMYDAMFAAVNGAPAGYGAANSLLGAPNMSEANGNLYLDTIHGYLNPRMYEVLGLGGSTTNMNEIIEKTTEIYPNPATDNINIVSYAELINNIEVYNLSGQKVISKIVNATSTKLNTNGLAKGVYVVDIKTKFSSVKRKIIIE
ncbi:MAG: T9SS type A sorting domain-containing protein [Flavobacteriales bacterium]|jgi:hypothetical protein|nr:T9SS type A sorting domain-containing protein [Flavobacteriales bacterium]|tara:strand:+ start:4157 stop:5776 length:1620 start_codon:yes stop_codon:yes gene_type:complete